MGKRYAINLGLTKTDTNNHYDIPLSLRSAPHVAKYLNTFFKDMGFDDLSDGPWLDHEVTTDRFDKRMKELHQIVDPGDLIVISFCGHTYHVNKKYTFLKNHENEDEGWVFYDRVLFHFEIWRYAQGFKPGVQIIIMSDSCFSGSLESRRQEKAIKEDERIEKFWKRHKGLYNDILKHSAFPMQHMVPPSIVILSASAENEISLEMPGTDNTYFNEAFRRAWENREKGDTLSNFFDEINWELYNLIKGNTRYLPIAQWHYSQGHAYTGLRSRVPFEL